MKLLLSAGLAGTLAACGGGGDDTAATPSANNGATAADVAESTTSSSDSSRIIINGVDVGDSISGSTEPTSRTVSKAQVVRLYALFGLTLDQGGLDYWSQEPFSLQIVAERVLAAAQTVPGAHVEWMGTSTDAQFVGKVYGFLGLAPDSEGLQYWLGDIAHNGRPAMVAHFIGAMVAYKGSDPAALNRQKALTNASLSTVDRLIKTSTEQNAPGIARVNLANLRARIANGA